MVHSCLNFEPALGMERESGFEPRTRWLASPIRLFTVKIIWHDVCAESCLLGLATKMLGSAALVYPGGEGKLTPSRKNWLADSSAPSRITRDRSRPVAGCNLRIFLTMVWILRSRRKFQGQHATVQRRVRHRLPNYIQSHASFSPPSRKPLIQPIQFSSHFH